MKTGRWLLVCNGAVSRFRQVVILLCVHTTRRLLRQTNHVKADLSLLIASCGASRHAVTGDGRLCLNNQIQPVFQHRQSVCLWSMIAYNVNTRGQFIKQSPIEDMSQWEKQV